MVKVGSHAGGSSLKWLLAHISEGEETAEESQSSAHFLLSTPSGTPTHRMGHPHLEQIASHLISLRKAFGASLQPQAIKMTMDINCHRPDPDLTCPVRCLLHLSLFLQASGS